MLHKNREYADRKWMLALAVLMLLLAVAVTGARRSVLQRGIADQVLRFHVLANSDDEEDQRVKLQVRDEILKTLHEEQAAETYRWDRQRTKQFLQSHLDEMEETANRILQQQKMPYHATAEIARCYFPDRSYGELTFPAGWYEALRIRLGKAGGHNWWCVLYPQLCFSDCLHGVLEQEGKKELEQSLTVEEYDRLMECPSQWKITFRWF